MSLFGPARVRQRDVQPGTTPATDTHAHAHTLAWRGRRGRVRTRSVLAASNGKELLDVADLLGLCARNEGGEARSALWLWQQWAGTRGSGLRRREGVGGLATARGVAGGQEGGRPASVEGGRVDGGGDGRPAKGRTTGSTTACEQPSPFSWPAVVRPVVLELERRGPVPGRQASQPDPCCVRPAASPAGLELTSCPARPGLPSNTSRPSNRPLGVSRLSSPADAGG